jgi:hypothetical protein
MQTRRHLAAALFALAAIAPTAQAGMLDNGSFEDAGYSLPAGSYCYTTYAPLACGSVPGWQGSFQLIQAGSGPWGTPSQQAGFDSSWGGMVGGLQATSEFHQTVTLAAGSYALSWADANRQGYGGEQSYEVLFNGQSLGKFNTKQANGGQWTAQSLQFTASGAGELRFAGLATVDSTTFIDNIALSQVSAVPEPASIALLLAGLGAIGLARRSKR